MKFKSKKVTNYLFTYMSNFDIADLSYLEMHYQVVFLCLDLCPLEKHLLKINMNEFESKLKFEDSLDDLLKDDFTIVS